jgi:hypothetical protein
MPLSGKTLGRPISSTYIAASSPKGIPAYVGRCPTHYIGVILQYLRGDKVEDAGLKSPKS